MKKLSFLLILCFTYGFTSDNYYYDNHKKIYITKDISSLRTKETIQYYKQDNGLRFGITEGLIIKLKNDKNLHKYASNYSLKIEKKLAKNLYLLKAKNNTLTIDISNRLSEKDDVEFAHPDFIKKRVKR